MSRDISLNVTRFKLLYRLYCEHLCNWPKYCNLLAAISLP